MARAEGLNGAIEPWDWRYYAEKVRQAQYDLDEAEVKPYFVLDKMIEAAFDTAGRLFGLAFTEREDLSVYHPDVGVWEVRDRAGAHLGLFLHDNFARPGKQSGAWSSRFRDQESMDEPVAPIVVNNNNFVRGNVAGGEPTLLSFDDARTLFHEFGHGLHALLSRVRYRSQSGTSVLRDFVEFPSQIFEHWVSAPGYCEPTLATIRPESRSRRICCAACWLPGPSTRALRRWSSRHPPCSTSSFTAQPRRICRTSPGSRANSSTGWGCQRRSGCVTARRISSTCSPAAACRGLLPIFGRRLRRTALRFSDAGDVRPALAARLKDIYRAGDTRIRWSSIALAASRILRAAGTARPCWPATALKRAGVTAGAATPPAGTV